MDFQHYKPISSRIQRFSSQYFKAFTNLPAELQFRCTQFFPRLVWLLALENHHRPQLDIDEEHQVLTLNTSFLVQWLQGHVWHIDRGGRNYQEKTIDHDLWEALIKDPFGNDRIRIDYQSHRIEICEKRHSESWNDFAGTLTFRGSVLHYKKPTYFWYIDTLNDLVGSIVGRDPQIDSYGGYY